MRATLVLHERQAESSLQLRLFAAALVTAIAHVHLERPRGRGRRRGDGHHRDDGHHQGSVDLSLLIKTRAHLVERRQVRRRRRRRRRTVSLHLRTRRLVRCLLGCACGLELLACGTGLLSRSRRLLTRAIPLGAQRRVRIRQPLLLRFQARQLPMQPGVLGSSLLGSSLVHHGLVRCCLARGHARGARALLEALLVGTQRRHLRA